MTYLTVWRWRMSVKIASQYYCQYNIDIFRMTNDYWIFLCLFYNTTAKLWECFSEIKKLVLWPIYKRNQREWIRAVTKIAFTELEKASSVCQMIYKRRKNMWCYFALIMYLVALSKTTIHRSEHRNAKDRSSSFLAE